MIIQSKDPLGSLGRAIAMTREPLPHHHVEVLEKAPPRGAMVLSAGLIAGVAATCGGLASAETYFPTIFCLPFFLGALVGLCSIDHPVRSSLLTVLVATLILFLGLFVRYGLYETLYVVMYAAFTLPLVVPETIIGALCASTIRRYVRGRRAYTALGEEALARLDGGFGDQPELHMR